VRIADYAKLVKDGNPAPVAGAGVPKAGRSGRIALVYAEGEIVDGEGEPGQIGGSRLSRELRKLRQDAGVKAVVLRVNSPGGSASAAEVIQREVRLIKAVKPLIVSMGSYAASGGYWISAYADRIFAEPATITGSIGVFGLQFDVQKLAGSFGVTFDSVKTGRFADALTHRPAKVPGGTRRAAADGRLDLRGVCGQGRRGAKVEARSRGGNRTGASVVGSGGEKTRIGR
jgi:protease-4